MAIKTSTFEHDVVQIIRLGSHYQIKYLQSIKMPGWETLEPVQAKNVNNHKLSNNRSRALRMCREIALSNDWQYFITLTLDPKKYDRFDLPKFHKDLSIFFKRLNRQRDSKIKYLLVPEKHSNNAWHIHGLVSGLCRSDVSINSNGFLQFDAYSNQFGFCSLSCINSSVAVAFYVSKHISKQIQNGVTEIGSHLYYCSRGLKRGELVGLFNAASLPNDFKFQYESEDRSFKSSFYEDDTFLKSLNLI